MKSEINQRKPVIVAVRSVLQKINPFRVPDWKLNLESRKKDLGSHVARERSSA
jgi:hypothetical protein